MQRQQQLHMGLRTGSYCEGVGNFSWPDASLRQLMAGGPMCCCRGGPYMAEVDLSATPEPDGQTNWWHLQVATGAGMQQTQISGRFCAQLTNWALIDGASSSNWIAVC